MTTPEPGHGRPDPAESPESPEFPEPPEHPDDVLRALEPWHRELRAQFPILRAAPGLAYLDSAATSQKPQAVLDAVQTYLTTANANAGRGSYPWANRTTALVEKARQQVGEALGDPCPDTSQVLLTSGATEALRTVARDWLADQLADGDEVVVPFADHQANITPWQEVRDLLARRGIHVRLRPMPYQSGSGDYDHAALAEAVTPRTRFVATTHVHHVYGNDMNVHRIRAAVGPDVPICLDASQSVGHQPIRLDTLDVDFAVFSGHKALALPGTGALWARQARGPALRPAGWAGTPNTVGAVSLSAALDWLRAADTARVHRWTRALTARLTDALSRLGSYQVLGCRTSLAAESTVQRRQSLVSFRHRAIPSGDLGFVLFDSGLMVRSDQHCQGGSGERTGSVRVSTHAYTSVDEIDRLVEALRALD
ncbi:putative aminotransferase [Actinacidiphila reveromycinica]|uniref:Putative aminotransferase n=1 Tax=Actinacidiphila reveromycinica TaxID=659352 RepID=A0A7U3UYR2_9ACTN|nr:aminotransferase class V-fold PLP-dependent enzyme [Streptomyces sp. SN-593]BBB01175.1 putative aminotransferase [Streptomyces sp. SN-593]